MVIKSIDEARQSLAAIDVRLSECENILLGYKQAIDLPQTEEAPAEDQQFYEGEPE